MTKRKSWDEKAKGMHKSRKVIIDTVFGREDNTQRVFGYEKEGEKKRKVGEVWTDSEGKKWKQENGFKVAVTEMDDVRRFLEKLTTCHNEQCETKQYSNPDKKLIRKTGYCLDCLQKVERELKNDGTFPFYEDYKITRNKLDYVRDLKAQMEEALRGVKQQLEMVSEDGRIEKWTWDVDVEQVKKDLQRDIDGAYDAIEALLERKAALEDKFRELNHPELIRN